MEVEELAKADVLCGSFDTENDNVNGKDVYDIDQYIAYNDLPMG